MLLEGRAEQRKKDRQHWRLRVDCHQIEGSTNTAISPGCSLVSLAVTFNADDMKDGKKSQTRRSADTLKSLINKLLSGSHDFRGVGVLVPLRKTILLSFPH